jgi:hypothetical protein
VRFDRRSPVIVILSTREEPVENAVDPAHPFAEQRFARFVPTCSILAPCEAQGCRMERFDVVQREIVGQFKQEPLRPGHRPKCSIFLMPSPTTPQPFFREGQ